MKVIIIEDEQLTAEDLKESIIHFRPNFVIEKLIGSVSEGLLYFASKPKIDLIFTDIQLGDGQTFEIFKAYPPKVPVIFCTAYNEFAIQAFQANGIDYLLKPFGQRHIENAISKFENFTKANSDSYLALEKLLHQLEQSRPALQKSILVRKGDKIIPIPFSEVALFYVQNEVTYLLTFNNHAFPTDLNLENIEQLELSYFFRANRQIIIHRKATNEVLVHFGRKLLIKPKVDFQEQIFVSKEKSSAFLKWLETEV